VTAILGVDGYKGGWIAASKADIGGVNLRVIGNVRDLITSIPTVLAIDIPIGLSDGKPRQCDPAARRLLGRRRASSVFPAPFREVARLTEWTEANAFSKGKYGQGISRQVGARGHSFRRERDHSHTTLTSLTTARNSGSPV
jgi:predicted RNase H-like nuclease